jgi:hypothetical protein
MMAQDITKTSLKHVNTITIVYLVDFLYIITIKTSLKHVNTITSVYLVDFLYIILLLLGRRICWTRGSGPHHPPIIP